MRSHLTRMVAGTLGAHSKEGSMEQIKSSTVVAGVDVGKFKLDAAIDGQAGQVQVSNAAAGIAALCDWLRQLGVSRVGMEATGGYERKLRAALEAQGIEVVLHQPLEVKLYGRLSRQHAKTDTGDARLIAAATRAIERPARRVDPLLVDLSERLTAYEHITDLLMSLRTFRDSLSLADLDATIGEQIDHLATLKAGLARQLIVAIKASTQLRARYELLMSLPGIGPIVAASLLVRMPELGSMAHGQAASLIGVAPHARDSGRWKGERFISGGRARPRRMLYLAALAARRFDKALRDFADGLIVRGKPPKLAIVAVMRKLIEAANLVLKRNQPWIKRAA
jgi:transposase